MRVVARALLPFVAFPSLLTQPLLADNRFDFPADPDYLVLEYMEPLGFGIPIDEFDSRDSNELPRTGSVVIASFHLWIYGDGHVVISRPKKGVKGLPMEEGWLTFNDVMEILAKLESLGVMD